MNNDDMEWFRSLRNRVLYAGYKNSLVEWTVSDAWTDVPRVVDWKGDRLARGHRVLGITQNEIQGEIQCR